MKLTSFFLAVLALACSSSTLTPLVNAASLLAIDYGTDSFKASLVKPGVPFDVIINKDSKRKTPSIVTIRGEEDRSFGGEAASLSTRFPKDSFQSIKLLLGHPHSHSQSQLHQSLFSSSYSTTPRGSPSLTSSKTSFSVEELLAMQFVYAKEMADELAGEPVKDCVVTVPVWFAEGERKAMLDALELAGLRPLGLVNDGTAAAVNYALGRSSFPATPSYHLLYDLGAGSLRTTLVSLKSALLPDPLSLAAKPTLQNVTSLTVHGVGWDTTVGGYVMDGLVRDLMKEEFEEKNQGVKLGQDGRAMAKLLKEAARVKQVLSANTESMGRVEGLIDDIDLRTTISRSSFESRAAHLLPHFTAPIHQAFEGTNLTLDDVESVILIGGSSRVPMVEKAVREVVGEGKIAKNLNADEAAVMGAALYGAGLSRGFRTKDIRVQDVTPFGIDVSYEADKATADAETRTITTHLFPRLGKNNVKKTMTFKKTEDFAIQFGYRKDENHPEIPTSLFETRISGLTKAFANVTEEVKANATVKVTIELDESNLVGVSKAVVVFAETQGEGGKEGAEGKEGFNEKLKGLLGKFGSKDKDATGKDKTDSPAAASDEDPDAPKVDDPFGGGSDEDKEATRAKLEELLRAATPVNSTVPLEVGVAAGEGARGRMGREEMMDSRKRLREMKSAETRKLAREEARNVLEAYIYKVRDLVDQPTFAESSVESERKVIREKVESANEWLWDEGETAGTKDLKSKKGELEKLVKHVLSRSIEATQRPGLIATLESLFTEATSFLTSAHSNLTLAEAANEVSRYTLEELSALEKIKTTSEGWLKDLVKKQVGVKGYEDPVLKVSELERKVKELSGELVKLGKKKMPRKKKVVASTSASASASGTEKEKVEESATKSAGEEQPEATAGGERKKDEL